MESNYIVVFNEPKKGQASAATLCKQIDAGALIISVTPTHDSVHYLIGFLESPETPHSEELAKLHRDIIRDNLDAEEAAELEAPDSVGGD